MKIYKHLVNFILLSSLLFTACKKGGDSVNENKPPQQDTIPKYVQTADVYVAGRTYDSVTYTRQAAYWKNGVAVILTHGTENANANAIAVDGNDVYTAGYTTDANGAYIATYWKNNVQVNLTTNATNASAGHIVVKGNDVYIEGFIETSAVYWKNGQQVTLSLLPNRTGGSSGGIAIEGSDIYLSGYQSGFKTSAVYWKNNVPTELPNNIPSYAGNIVVQNGNVYVPISYIEPYSDKTVINYYKNNTPVSLADGTLAINAMDIAVQGTDVYLACNTAKGPGYFKNNKLSLISVSDSEILDIAVSGNDVYTAGQSTYQNRSVPTFWKNNTPVYLFSSIGKSGSASSIVVKPFK